MVAKTKYVGQSKWMRLDENGAPTGEIKIIDEFERRIDGRSGFVIAYLETIITLIERLGNKKMMVVKYILKEMSKSENLLIATTREISKKAGVSQTTVIETLKTLEEANIIKRKTGVIMLNPKLLHRGNAGKERYLLTKFHTL